MKKMKKGKEKKAPISMHRHGYVLPLAFVFILLFILALASSICTTVSAQEAGAGCPSETKYQGTIHGGVYYVVKGPWNTNPPLTVTFDDVPDGIRFARVYTGVWAGSPGKGGKFNITIANATSSYTTTTYQACDPCPGQPCADYQSLRCDTVNTSECHDYVTGCNVHFISYNATPYITPGSNTITIRTDCDSCTCWDGRIYLAALLVLYEDASMPEITYWINEGSPYMEKDSDCDGPDNHHNFSIYFNGSVYPGSVSDLKYWTFGFPHAPGVNPELNGKYVGTYDHIQSYEGYDVFFRWDNIPVDYLTTSENLFYYYNPSPAYERVYSAVLMLNSSGPGDLAVTNISLRGNYADPDETGRYANVVNATVVNYGKPAYLFNLTLYVNDSVVDVKRVTNFAEGESRDVSFLWAPNETGSYELNVTADPENIVKETDEMNNSKTLSVEVTIAPPPAWQSQSSNVSSIPNGGTIELRAQAKAGYGLDSAVLATDETGTGVWINITDGRYGSPMDMASYYNYSVTHTSDANWKVQTIENVRVTGGDVVLDQITGTINIAEGKPSYAKDSLSLYPPGNANDGNPSSFWYSGVMPNWWKVDLGEVTDVKKITIDFHGYCGCYKYTISISDDDETWTTKIARGVGKDETFTGLGWSCRYINVSLIEALHTESCCDYNVAAIAEFEAYGYGDYKPNGTLTSKTVATTDHPIVSVTPEWNSTESAGINLSVNVSVDNGVTWEPAANETELTWDYDVYNTKLKYRVLFETSDVNETPVLHDITLNYTTRDPVEGEWLWSNFTWHNASVINKTVQWKIYYEDMLGQTNCTEVKTFDVGTAGVANVVVDVHTTSFGNMLAGDNTTIYISLTLNNSEGTAPATIEAVFKTNVSVVYGLNGTFGSNIIPGNYFELGPDTNEKALTNTTTKTTISIVAAGAIVDYNAILIVPAGQAADDYSGIVELSW